MKKVLIFVLTLFLSIKSVQALKIVSLGDSVPNGYLLSDSTMSFDNLFSNALNAELYEFSYIGMRSDDLLSDLDRQELKDNILNADIVIINIGANDLLDLLDYVDLSEIGIVVESGTVPKINLSSKKIPIIKAYLDNIFINELKPMSIDAAKDFSIIFPNIIRKIKEYNPNTRIIVNNLYNPFFNISVPLLNIDLNSIERETDEIIASFNDTIYNNDGYEIIDIYSILRNNDYLNVNPISLSFDPHPNIEGHKKIYELYLNELCYRVTYNNEDYYTLKNESINIKPKNKIGYTFVKWNYDIHRIESNIELKAIYKLNYICVVIPILIIIVTTILIIKKKH
jgi:lysophospholipase L1-like esterase